MKFILALITLLAAQTVSARTWEFSYHLYDHNVYKDKAFYVSGTYKIDQFRKKFNIEEYQCTFGDIEKIQDNVESLMISCVDTSDVYTQVEITCFGTSFQIINFGNTKNKKMLRVMVGCKE